MRTTADSREVVVVLWEGVTGGTETLMCELARSLVLGGHAARVVFIKGAGELASRLSDARVPFDEVHLDGAGALVSGARRLARVVAGTGAACAILPTVTYLAAVLRAGGFKGRIVSVDHGAIVNLQSMSGTARWRRMLSRRAGVMATDIQVGVSDYMLGAIGLLPHARDMRRVYNGVDASRFRPAERRAAQTPASAAAVRFGFAGRHIPGKGLPELVEAFKSVHAQFSGVELNIAGVGPETERVRALVDGLPVAFHGLVEDMPSFWQRQDAAVVPSNSFVETFGMVAAEAMATGLPVVATRNGALPELVVDDSTGLLCEPGDVDALAAAMLRYARHVELRERHGRAGRERCEAMFSIERTAEQYLSLCGCDS